jgi:Sec-independent protein translocase protein TatA
VSINLTEVALVLFVAVMVIQPEKLPAAAQTLGKWLKWFRQTSAKLKRELEIPFDNINPSKIVSEEKPHDP